MSTDAGTGVDGGSMMDGGGGDAGIDAGIDASVPYDEFDAWRELQQALRASPDAVPARANALIAAHDARGLFELVRDDIALLPTTTTNFDSASYRVRWGARATLRGQAGTPRERADLLQLLLTKAGFQAEVVVGTPVSGSTITGLLAHGPQRRAHYDLAEPRWSKISDALPRQGAPWGRDFAPVDPDGGVRSSVLAQIEPLLPAAPMPAPFDATLDDVPLVRITIDGGTVYANPNIDGAQFGESRTANTPDPATPANGERTIRVTLSASRSSRPGDKFTLLDHTFNASDVASRTITAAFVAPYSRAQARETKVGDVNAFIPTLVVRGDGLDEDASQALSVIGSAVLRDGTVIERADGGGLIIEGEAIAPSPTPDARIASVTALTSSVSASGFPDVELLVSAKNASNVRVADLGADAFQILEDGAPVVASLRRTHVTAPKVVLLFDRSSSIPTEFLNGAPTIGHAIADAIFTQFAGSSVQVAGVGINGPTIAGGMVTTLAEVDAQLAMLGGTGSDVWTSTDGFSESAASAVVIISDMDATDMPTPDMLARFLHGPPALVAGVGTVNAAVAAHIAAVTHGDTLSNVTDMNLPSQITAFIAARQLNDYRIVYRAPATGATPRQVTVRLRMPSTVTTSGTYTPPAMPDAPSALSALYLTVDTDGHAVTRKLAGGKTGSAQEIEEVAGALFGRFVLGVEAGAPSLSTLLDETLTERLELEPGIDALRAADMNAIAEAAKTSYFRVPPALRFGGGAALPGEQDANDFTFVDGLTVTLHATLPRLGTKMVRRFDLLPLEPRRTITVGGSGNPFTITVQRTAGLAAFENQFGKNTAKALQGKTLALFDWSTVEGLGPQWVGAAYPAYYDYHVLAPADGSVLAFWAVHKTTGQVIGVMPEGGVGEEESTEALVNRLQTLLDAASRAGAGAGYNGLKVWADLESTKVGLLGSVIMLFEGTGTTGDVLSNMCSSAVDAAGGEIPGWDTANMIPNDLNSIYRAGGLVTGHPVPTAPTISTTLCGAALSP
ncbi:MAG: hypothetical protein QM817_10060 [Archangium sp.]